jgi:hypothetical protein
MAFHRVFQGNLMATRTRVRTVAAGNEPQLDEESTELNAANVADDDPEDDALAELRGLGGAGEYKYTVSRVSNEPGKKSGYCKTYAIGDLSLDSIREEFGGGKYRVRVTDAQGKYVSIATVDIVDLPKTASAPAAVAAPNADLQGIAALLQSVKPATGGESGMTQILVAMIASQGEMMKAIAAGNKDKGPSPMEIIAMIKSMQPEKSATDPVELLLRGLELGKGMVGGESSMMDIAREGLGIIGPLISQGKQPPVPVARLPHRGPPAPAAQLPHLGDAAPVAPLVTNDPATPEGANVKVLQQIDWIRKQLAALVHHAARDKSPELYAEVMLDNLPPFITSAEIMEHIGAPDAIAKLAQLDERVNQYLPWFEEFRVAISEFLSPDDDADDDDGTADLDKLGEAS